MYTSQSEHERKVQAVAAQVRGHASRGEPVVIKKGGVSHFVPLPGDTRFRLPPVDVSALCGVMDVNPETRLCVAEPGVTFAEVLEVTLRYGLIPTVVPELTGISLGGAVVGCSVEAMSYKYGGFHDACVEYELLTGEGDLLTCSPTVEPDLFHMVHGSYGTLAILTRVTFKLVPAKRAVRLEYRQLDSAERFHQELLARVDAADYDFVDGIIHSPSQQVLCLGSFVEDPPYLSDYTGVEIFYKSTLDRPVDYLSTRDYCFRYDTECHWLTRTVPPLEWKPVRRVLGSTFLGSTNLIRWSKRLDPIMGLKRRPDVVVDVFIPSPRFVEFFRWYQESFRFYPLWVVPYLVPEVYPWISPAHAARMEGKLFMDCAVYGRPNGEPGVDYSQLIEEKTYDLGGIKTLISRNHYTRERFWDIYNRERWTAAKKRLDPRNAFPDLYDHFHRVG